MELHQAGTTTVGSFSLVYAWEFFSLTDSRWWKLWFSSQLCKPDIEEDRSKKSS